MIDYNLRFLVFHFKIKYHILGESMFGVFSVLLSTINFYFLVKLLSNKPSHQKELDDFQSHVERLMVEFNRITTRNIELLDSRIEELDHKIRLSQKTESHLKELFEDAQKRDFLPMGFLSETTENISTDISTIEDQNTINTTENREFLIDNPIPSFSEILSIESKNHKTSKPEIADTIEESPTIETENPKKTISDQSDTLFEGVPIKKIKKHSKKNTQQQLMDHIQQNKSKDELLELGFNINEINLAMLCSEKI